MTGLISCFNLTLPFLLQNAMGMESITLPVVVSHIVGPDLLSVILSHPVVSCVETLLPTVILLAEYSFRMILCSLKS